MTVTVIQQPQSTIWHFAQIVFKLSMDFCNCSTERRSLCSLCNLLRATDGQSHIPTYIAKTLIIGCFVYSEKIAIQNYQLAQLCHLMAESQQTSKPIVSLPLEVMFIIIILFLSSGHGRSADPCANCRAGNATHTHTVEN